MSSTSKDVEPVKDSEFDEKSIEISTEIYILPKNGIKLLMAYAVNIIFCRGNIFCGLLTNFECSSCNTKLFLIWFTAC